MDKKINPEELKKLTEIFRKYGADDPELWAESQLSEGIPQLAIFSFAKALWEGVVNENNLDWVDKEIKFAEENPKATGAQIGPIMKEMLDKGVSRESIIELIRVMQYFCIYRTCSIIDGSSSPDVPITDWTLYQTDKNGKPVAIIQGLHEVIMSLDPTGREMDPKK
jgi:hypothetical protein